MAILTFNRNNKTRIGSYSHVSFVDNDNLKKEWERAKEIMKKEELAGLDPFCLRNLRKR